MDIGHYHGYIDASSFPKTRDAEISGFIENVDRDLRQFYHAERRSLVITYVFAVFFGMFGVHHFYLGRNMYGLMYLCTFGLFGFGYLLDLFRLPSLVKDANIRRDDEEVERTLLDVYVLWFPFGILGFHHFYLRDNLMGVLYLLSGGILGIGWLIDGIHLSGIVQQYNNKEYSSISLLYAYLFMIPPFGILGFHHYYCRRTLWGVLYTLTLGGFLLGWIVDFIRIPFLVSRMEVEETDEDVKKKYYNDDAYVLWLSFGLLGFHHFYLKRYRWGIVYVFTLGVFGIGWVADAFRIPLLVRQLNLEIEEEEDISNVVSNFNKKRQSVISRKNDNYSRFHDVMQNHQSDSPRIFTIQRNTNVFHEVQDQTFDDVTSEDDHDDNNLEIFKIRKVRRTMSSDSNSTHTVTVEVHPSVDRGMLPLSVGTNNMEDTQTKTLALRKKSRTKKAELKNTVQQNHIEKKVSFNESDINDKTSKELYSVSHRESSDEDVESKINMVSRPKQGNGQMLNVTSQQKDNSEILQTKPQVVKDTAVNSRKRGRRKSDRTSKKEQQELTDRRSVHITHNDSGAVLNKMFQVSKQSDTITQNTDNTTTECCKEREDCEENGCSEENVPNPLKTKTSVGRSVSIISQKSSTEQNTAENSMTSIDVNRMSIPILDNSFDEGTMDTPRSMGALTARSDTDNYNSLPRVIKVRKSKSMEQTKRNIRRSIKRSRKRTQAPPVEKISEERVPQEDNINWEDP